MKNIGMRFIFEYLTYLFTLCRKKNQHQFQKLVTLAFEFRQYFMERKQLCLDGINLKYINIVFDKNFVRYWGNIGTTFHLEKSNPNFTNKIHIFITWRTF